MLVIDKLFLHRQTNFRAQQRFQNFRKNLKYACGTVFRYITFVTSHPSAIPFINLTTFDFFHINAKNQKLFQKLLVIIVIPKKKYV